MTQIKAGGGLTLTVRGDLKLAGKSARPNGGRASALQRLNSRQRGSGLFIWLRSCGADGILF